MTFFKGKICKLFAINSIVFSCFVFNGNSQELPENPSVTHGNASFEKVGNNLTIKQSTQKLITNWSSFNIGKANQVEFKQPSSVSTALNRVQSNDPTHIYGSLKSNGQLVLINPSGVLFHNGSKVDVGSIIASTLNLKDGDFINDKYVFQKNGLSGVVNNQGEIKAFEGGTIALIAPQIQNKGKIETTNGTAALISGERVSLSLNGNNLIQYSIERGVLNSLIDNKQAISVNSGTIILSAKGVKEVKNAVVNNSGTLRADGITKQGGKIFLTARNGKISNSGTIAANSNENKAGSVRVTAEKIEINNNSSMETMGQNSGGLIEIGGSWQNSNKDVYQATTTKIAEGASLDASAYDFGDGGEIVVWSDIHNSNSKTTVRGTLKAEGGKIKGNGGRIETSGRNLDINNIKISTKSTVGVDGQWLIDPYDITIKNESSSDVNGSYTATGNNAVVDVGTLETALASSNITVFTGNGGFQNGDITVQDPISSNSSNDLILDSQGDIIINANITRSGSGGLVLNANSNQVNGTGTINLASGSSISAEAGVTVQNNINLTSSGNVNFGGTGTSTYSGTISGSGNINKVDSGTVILNGSNSYSGSTLVNAGTLRIDSTNSVPSNHTLTSNGGIYDVRSSITLESLSGTGEVRLSSGGTLTLDSSSNINFGGVFSGTGTLAKNGTNDLTLTGTNTHTGFTNLNAGTLIVKGLLGNTYLTVDSGAVYSVEGGDDTIGAIAGAGNIHIPSGDTLTTNTSNTTTFSGVISGPSGDIGGNLIKSGNGTLTLTGINTYAGTTTISGGTISISADSGLGSAPGSPTAGHLTLNGGTLQSTVDFTLNSNRGIALGTSHGTINVDGSTTLTYDGIIAGSNDLTKSGTGTLKLSNSNTYSGNTTVNQGTLQITGALADTTDVTVGSVGTYQVDTTDTIQSLAGTGNVSLANGITLTTGDGGDDIFSGVISGTGNLVKVGSGTLTLSGINNSYTGTTTISAGALTVSGRLGSGTHSSNIINNSSLNFTSSSAQTLSGVISGTGLLTKSNSGALTLSGSNTYSGTTTISGGTISISADSGLGSAPGSPTAGHLTLNGGTLQSTADFTLNSNRGIALGTSHGTINVDGSTTLTYDGIIAGSNNLTKRGDGILLLSGANTYSGDTAIRAGTFLITGTLADTTDVTVRSGAIYDVDTTDTIQSLTGDGSVELASGITLTTGDVNDQIFSGVISGSGHLEKAGSGTLTLSGTNTYTGTTTISAGMLTVSGLLGSGTHSSNIINNSTLNYTTSSDQTLSGVISGTGLLTQNGSGTLTLSGTNTYSGTTTINSGTISISADSGLGAAPGSATAGHLTINGGTLQSTADFTMNANRGVALGSNHGTFNVNSGTTMTVAGVVAGSNNLIKSGDGTLVLSGVNTYSGDTIISDGTLQTTGTLADTTDVSVSSGAIYDVDATDTIQSLSGAGNVELASGITLTTGDANNHTISGVISGSGHLEQQVLEH